MSAGLFGPLPAPPPDNSCRAAVALGAELAAGRFGLLREAQWCRPSAGGVILVRPPCFMFDSWIDDRPTPITQLPP